MGLLALVFRDGGERMVRWLAPFSAYQMSLVELNAASRGDGPDGQEYVLFLREGAGPKSLSGFFRDHPAVRYVSPGLVPGVAVVHIRADVSAALGVLRAQPAVRLILKSRLGMVCH